jgi:hypothetical protein
VPGIQNRPASQSAVPSTRYFFSTCLLLFLVVFWFLFFLRNVRLFDRLGAGIMRHSFPWLGSGRGFALGQLRIVYASSKGK